MATELLVPIAAGYYSQQKQYGYTGSHHLGVLSQGDGKGNGDDFGNWLKDTYILTSPSITGTIEKITCIMILGSGAGYFGEGHYQLRLNGVDYNNLSLPTIVDIPVNPATGLSWTKPALTYPYFQAGTIFRHTTVNYSYVDYFAVLVTYSSTTFSKNSRVTRIRHSYRPGYYRMELGFGEVTDEVKNNISRVTIKPSVADTAVTAPPSTVEAIDTAIKEDTTPAPAAEPSVAAPSVPSPPLVVEEPTTYPDVNPASDDVTMEKQPIGSIEDMKATIKRRKAFNKYGYEESWVRARLAEGWSPAQIVTYMMEHPIKRD